MKKFFFLFLGLLILAVGFLGFKFRKHLPYFGRFFRVSTAQRVLEIEPGVLKRFTNENIDISELENQKILIVVIKDKKELFLFLEDSGPPRLLKRYPMTAFSGKLGPKNQEGDHQIPEGIYKIEGLNPNSLYHLSLKLDYPNALDIKRAKANGIDQPGSNIFIHGKEVTVGCVPLGDRGIEELFYIVHRVGKSNVRVVLSPTIEPSNFDFQKYAKNSADKPLLREKYEILFRELSALKDQLGPEENSSSFE